MIDYAKLSIEDLYDLRDLMEVNLRTSVLEAERMAGSLEDKRVELERLEEIEMTIKLCKSCIEYLNNEINKRNK